MRTIKPQFGILLALLFILTMISTCNIVRAFRPQASTSQTDTVMFNRLQKQRADLEKKYTLQISQLEIQNDSLKSTVQEKKKALIASRLNTSALRDQLNRVITEASVATISPDSLQLAVNNYYNAQAQSDTACDQTIQSLQLALINRDSTIALHNVAEVNLKDLQKDQELRVRLLTDELNTAYKTQRKKVRQNRLLTFGMVFISGITTTLLVKQTVK